MLLTVCAHGRACARLACAEDAAVASMSVETLYVLWHKGSTLTLRLCVRAADPFWALCTTHPSPGFVQDEDLVPRSDTACKRYLTVW